MGLLSSLTGSKTTTSNKPWQYAEPYIRQGLGNLMGQSWQDYGQPWYASMNPMMQGAFQNMYGAGQDMYGFGNQMMQDSFGGVNKQLEAMQNNPSRFTYDQGLYNQIFNNMSGGMDQTASRLGLQSQRNLNSQMGQLQQAAGMSGQFGSKAGKRLLGQSAMASALNREGLQNSLNNLYQGAAGVANQGAMQGSMAGFNAANQNRSNILNTLMGMGRLGFGIGQQGLQNQYTAGMGQFGYDKYAKDMDLKDYMNRVYGQQGFLGNQLNAATGVGSAFGTTTQRKQGNVLDALSGIAGVAGSFMGLGGLGGGMGGGMGGGIPGAGGVPLNVGSSLGMGGGYSNYMPYMPTPIPGGY